MNIKLVLRVLAFLSIFLGIGMLLPLPFSYYYNSGDATALMKSAAVCFSIGLLVFIPKDISKNFKTKDGFAIVTFGWIIMALLGSLPYLFSGAIPNFTNAIFETMSGFTTTGSTILTDIEALPKGILFWRSITHWLGGMGIIVLTIAILPFLGIAGMQLFKAESSGPFSDKLKPRITHTAKLLWTVYLVLTITELLMLMSGGMGFYDSINHAFATLATGGFSTYNSSIVGQSSYIQYVLIAFMVLAGTNFSLHYYFVTGNFTTYFRSPEFRFYFFSILIASFLIFFNIYTQYDGALELAFRDSLFQVVSCVTCTGFASADYELWGTTPQLLLLLLMMGGGMAGSTAGGIKTVRLILLLKFTYNQFVKVLHPKAVVPLRIGSRYVDEKTVLDVLGFFMLYIVILATSVLLLTVFGLDLISSIGAVVTAMSGVGPGLNLVGPMDNFSFLPDVSKWLLSFLMLAGRLELLTVIILLSPNYWHK